MRYSNVFSVRRGKEEIARFRRRGVESKKLNKNKKYFKHFLFKIRGLSNYRESRIKIILIGMRKKS